MDCVGLLIVAARDLGIDIPDMPGYRRTPNPQKFIGHIFANSRPETEIIPGHFGVFRDGTQPCHAGIFAERDGKPTLIHAYAGTGKVMEELFIHDWPSRLFAIRSIEGLE
ncbi:cell wall peptidase NlpC/P60 family [Erythrobacter phage vB_EliS-L02]|nr:cell wall peptidase NlpC/P60 family [Erythrobacter phage vB_EliS-L02]